MILDRTYSEVFKTANVPNPDRRYIRFVSFVRDPRTGLHGLLVFKNDSYQIWSITEYEDALKASLNKNVRLFPIAPLDIQLYGRGKDTQVFAINVLAVLYQFTLDHEAECLVVNKKVLEEALYVRFLPNRSAFVAATCDGKLAKYSIEGHRLNDVEIPNRFVPKCFATSSNGKTAAVGGENGQLVLFVVDETMELQYATDAGAGCIRTLHFTADGNQILVGGQQAIIKIFTFEDLGTETRWENTRCFACHSDTVTTICSTMSVDGEQFASASVDGVICLWSLRQEEPLHVFKLNQELASALNFSLDAKYLVVGTDEGSLRIYNVGQRVDFTEPQEFIDEHQMLERFWHLEGPTLFDLHALRKSLGVYNEEEDGQVFWKLECNPGLKLREAYQRVNEEKTEQKERETKALRKIRIERRRNRRIVVFQYKVERMRSAALSKGLPFTEPEMPAFDTEPEDNEDLSDLETAYAEFNESEEKEDEPVEENKENRKAQSSGQLASSPSLIDDSQRSSPDDAESPNLAQQSGILLSDSDDEVTNKSPVGSTAEDVASANSAAADQEGETQLWATDDEGDANQESISFADGNEAKSPLESPTDESNARPPSTEQTRRSSSPAAAKTPDEPF